MKRLTAIPLSLLLVGCLSVSVFAQQSDTRQPKKKTRQVTRVGRPDFSKPNPKIDVWFDNVFEEGIVGQRPDGSKAAPVASNGNNASEGDASSASGWAALIGGDAIESEIKSLNLELAKSVTTPVKFKTTYNEVRQTTSILSMVFAIVSQYDGDVRWKDDAAKAQAAFAKATINARSNADTAFNYCNGRKFELEDLIRGGSFPETEKPAEELDWSDVIGRTETMVRLQRSDELLKQWTADADTFAKQKKKIIQEAQWVAAIGAVIAKEGMDDADVDEYVEFCVQMKDAASETAAAAELDNYEATSKFANLMSQSCNNCHEEWR